MSEATSPASGLAEQQARVGRADHGRGDMRSGTSATEQGAQTLALPQRAEALLAGSGLGTEALCHQPWGFKDVTYSVQPGFVHV